MSDEAKLPTEEEIALLPRWARVALAARCARRVLPQFARVWRDATIADQTLASTEHGELDRMIELVENAAAGLGMPTNQQAWLLSERAREIGNRAYQVGSREAGNWAKAGRPTIHSRAAFGEIAGRIATATAFALSGLAPADSNVDRRFVLFAAKDASSAIPDEYRNSIRADYTRLTDELAKNAWDDDSPIPSSVFGPLWPEGLPPGWPTEDLAQLRGIVLELHSEPDADPHLIGDAVVKLWEVANEYHMACGGGVLTIDEFKQLMPALVPVGPAAGS